MEFDELKVLLVGESRGGIWGGVVHDFGDAERILGGAGGSGIGEPSDWGMGVVEESDGFAAGGHATVVAADHQQSLSAGGPGGAMAEGIGVWGDVDGAVCRNDGSLGDVESDAPVEMPIGDIDGIAVGVQQLDVLFVLVFGDGVVVVGSEVDGGVGRLRRRDAGIVLIGGVGLSDEEVCSADLEVLVLEVVEGLSEVGFTGGVVTAPDLSDEIGVPEQLIEQDGHLGFVVTVGGIDGAEEGIHEGSQSPEVHLFDDGGVEGGVNKPVPGV